MPNLTPQTIREKLDIINSPEERSRRAEALDRYMFYNGNIQPIIRGAIQKEFKKPETVNELCARIVPINTIRKIITKLAAVYVESPSREASDGNEMDQEFVDDLQDAMRLNVKMKENNAYFKLDKKILTEILITEDGYPYVRNLPAFSYKVFSHSLITPEVPDMIVKIINPGEFNLEKQRYIFWTNEQFAVVDGGGAIRTDEMLLMDNPEGTNPFGTLPFVYMSESGMGIEPVDDDDLLRTSIAINISMSDILFASRFKSFPILWTVGYNGDLPANPNSVIHLDYDVKGNAPQINQISPDLDITSMLKVIESLLTMLLSSRNLSVKTISNTISVENIASGVSKALDQSEVLEDRKKQHDDYMYFETMLWDKLAHKMIPVWRKNSQLNQYLNREFSPAFTLSITLREPKIAISEMELIDVELKKREAGFTTLERSLGVLYPDMDSDEIIALAEEIRAEKGKNLQAMQKAMRGDDDNEEVEQS